MRENNGSENGRELYYLMEDLKTPGKPRLRFTPTILSHDSLHFSLIIAFYPIFKLSLIYRFMTHFWIFYFTVIFTLIREKTFI